MVERLAIGRGDIQYVGGSIWGACCVGNQPPQRKAKTESEQQSTTTPPGNGPLPLVPLAVASSPQGAPEPFLVTILSTACTGFSVFTFGHHPFAAFAAAWSPQPPVPFDAKPGIGRPTVGSQN